MIRRGRLRTWSTWGAAVLALALLHPPGHRLLRLRVSTALPAGGLLTLYGGALVAVGALGPTGVLGEPADPVARRRAGAGDRVEPERAGS